MIQRIAGITAGIAGVGAATGTLLAARQEDGPGLLVGAGIAGAGTIALGGGIGAARWAEHALHPGITRAARSTAAVGAALVAGAVAGTVASFVAGRFDAHRDTDVASDELTAAKDRAAKAADAAKQPAVVDAQAQRAGDLADESGTAAVELQVDDGRIDLVGAPVSAAAGTISGQYDRAGDGLMLGDAQRTRDGKQFSVLPMLMQQLRDLEEDDDRLVLARADVEKTLDTQVDTGGTSGIIDVDEATRWYAEDGIGERNVTWGWKQHLDSIATVSQGDHQASLEQDARTTVSLGPVDEGMPMLALAGVDTLDDAQLVAKQLASSTGTTLAVVELPEDAPTRYALATMLVNDEPGYEIEDVRALHGRLHPSVRLLVDSVAELRLDQPVNDVSDAQQPAGTVPVSGRTIEAVATDIAERYDTGRDGLWLGDAQRSDDEGHTWTVAPMLINALEAKVEADPGTFASFEDTASLAGAIRSVAAGSSDPAILDGTELTGWNSSYGYGERDISYGWKDLFDSVAKGTKDADGDLQLGEFGDNAKLLALPTVYSLEDALDWAHQAAAAMGTTIAVVDLPTGAPTSYALAQLLDGDGYEAPVEEDVERGRGIDSRIVGVANAERAVEIQR